MIQLTSSGVGDSIGPHKSDDNVARISKRNGFFSICLFLRMAKGLDLPFVPTDCEGEKCKVKVVDGEKEEEKKQNEKLNSHCFHLAKEGK